MKPFKALIVDDIKLIRAELRLILGDFPEVEIVGEAASAGKALNLISELNPDVLFLDINLPRMSGFELLDRLPASDIKVIFITSYSNEYAEEARKYSPVDFLTKPVSKEKLSGAIKKLKELAPDRSRII